MHHHSGLTSCRWPVTEIVLVELIETEKAAQMLMMPPTPETSVHTFEKPMVPSTPILRHARSVKRAQEQVNEYEQYWEGKGGVMEGEEGAASVAGAA
jgi:hypothetical protein